MSAGGRAAGKTGQHSVSSVQGEPDQTRLDGPGASPNQVVRVDGYAYRWTGPGPLQIGDRVLLPANWLSEIKQGPGPFPGTVTGFGRNGYDGPLSSIVRKLERAEGD